MLMLADSGSTKCDWRLLDKNYKVVGEFSTMGYNPFFHTTRFIFDDIQRYHDLMEQAPEVSALHFYGAGSSNPARKEIIETAMHLVFRNADMQIEHDLLSAALATCDRQPGIACILGTGSNAGYFDGEKLFDDVQALGYILGDEGSGCYLGKKLLADFLYGKLPPQMHDKLKEEYSLSKEVIFDNVYRKPNPNVYIASFARFLSSNKENIYIRRLVKQGLLEFLDIHVCRYPNYREVPVHFVGSIAHFFEDVLREVTDAKRITVGTIMQQPVEGLVTHFRKYKMW